MENQNRNPPRILKQIQADAGSQMKGRLKIFFGYAAGVGKTYAMLQAAHEARGKGIDVVVGYIEPHTRPATMELVNGLEQLPVMEATVSLRLSMCCTLMVV